MTRIPEKLQEAIEAELERAKELDQANWKGISEARQELTERYRQQMKSKGQFMTEMAHRMAYLATRLPATYAACHQVLKEIRARAPDIQIKSVLDLGAGPGTAMWAAADRWNE